MIGVIFAVAMTVICLASFTYLIGEVGSWNPLPETEVNTLHDTEEVIQSVIPPETVENEDTIIDIMDTADSVESLPGAVVEIPSDLAKLTVQSLRQLASERNVVLSYKDRKADIIAKLEAAQLA